MEPMKPMAPMQPMKPMEPMEPMKQAPAWWPADLGQPSNSGSQNDSRYAYFDSAHRLVVDAGGQIKTYDTGSHRISGFGQRQSGSNAMTFQSDQGTVDLQSLRLVN